MLHNSVVYAAILFAQSCVSRDTAQRIAPDTPEPADNRQEQSVTLKAGGVDRLSEVADEVESLPILNRWHDSLRQRSSLAFHVVRITYARSEGHVVPWEHVCEGRLTYREPSQYTLELAPTQLNDSRPNLERPEATRWTYDGHQLSILQRSRWTRVETPAPPRVFLDCLPLEWIFCLDPAELDRRYYNSLFTARVGRNLVYLIDATPMMPEFWLSDLLHIEIHVDVDTLLLRHVSVEKKDGGLVIYDFDTVDTSAELAAPNTRTTRHIAPLSSNTAPYCGLTFRIARARAREWCPIRCRLGTSRCSSRQNSASRARQFRNRRL
jgi:hypothetical protein